MPDTPSSILVATFLVAILAFSGLAAVWDWRWRIIPNWLTVTGAVAGLAFHVATGGWNGLLAALAGFGVGFGLLLVLYVIGGSGAGDVKFMAALGTWVGHERIFAVFLMSGFVVLVFSIVMLAAKPFFSKQQEQPQQQSEPRSRFAKRRGGIIPYAIPAAASTWLLAAWIGYRTWLG